MLMIAVSFAVFSGITGAYISFTLPNMPTGPWVVVVLSSMAFFSFCFSPKKGLITRWYSKRMYERKIHSDHILKSLYHAWVKQKKGIPLVDIQKDFSRKESETNSSLKNLRKNGFIQLDKDRIHLKENGLKEARRIVRLHRLWELYLTEYMNIAPDHVHDTAEKMEHILTPEIEVRLDAKLNFPTTDPHESIIPRK
jgi:manganese/zinc/iron transport system permease protein